MAVLLADLDDTLVDRSQVMRERVAQAAQHLADEGLEEWLAEWDCDSTDVRDRRDFPSGVRARLGMTESVDELLQQWPHEFGRHHRLDEATQSVLRVSTDCLTLGFRPRWRVHPPPGEW